MGADLYESYAGSILATAALGVAAVAAKDHDNIALQLKYLSAPMILAGIGVILSVLGIYMVRTKEGASMKQLMGSLNLGINGSAVGIAILAIPVLMYLDLPNKWQIWGAIVRRFVSGIDYRQGHRSLYLPRLQSHASDRQASGNRSRRR